MNNKSLFALLCFHFLLVGAQDDMNSRLKEYEQLAKQETPTTMVKHIGLHSTWCTLDGRLKGKDLLKHTDYFLNFIKNNVKNINAYEAVEDFLKNYRYACKESLKKDNNNLIFLTKDVLVKVFSLFQKNKELTKKDDVINIICQIQDPLLLNALLYEADILQYVYTIPRRNIHAGSDIIKKGLNFGVNTSIKIFNVFRKGENAINNNSATLMHNKPLLPLISNKVCQYELFLDMHVHDKEYVHEQFLKSMLQPSNYEKLPPHNTLSRNVKNKTFTLILCLKNYSEKNKVIVPKPLREIILQKLLSYERAQRVRDYLLTEITLLNLDYLDGKENFTKNIKEIMDFVKNDLLIWFDRQVQML